MLMLLLLAPPQHAQAQDDLTFDTGVNITSRFIYRGVELGSSPHIQTALGINKGNFSVYGWGSYSLGFDDGAYKEVKFWANYTIVADGFSITPQIENHYSAYQDLFDFDEDTSTHVFQASARFALDGDVAPDFVIGYTFWGGPANTLYTEAGLNFGLGDYSMRTFLSTQVAPDATIGNPGFVDDGYVDNFVVNQIGITGSRTMEITDKFSIPLGVGLIVNPKSERIFVTATVSF